MKTDSEIQDDVTEELHWDAAIDAAKICVSVQGGLVTLSGQVKNYSEKWESERAAQRVGGVTAIVVKIAVMPVDPRSDLDIANAAAGALSWASYVPKNSIKIQVEDGWITLAGTVDWGYQRQNAAGAVRFLTGVRGLTNNILVKSDAPSTAIQTDIEEALERRFDSDDQDIKVSVTGREVTLSGTVTSWWQRDLACDSAWNAPGVQNVKNELIVS